MSTVKVTILGDMMCEPLLLKAARRNGSFDFSPVFSHVRELFQQSDLVIGNLETPIAGEATGYVNELFSFNAPKEFALAAKDAGVSLVSTANNHCLDRGFDGLLATVKNLDDIGLAHIGTYSSAECSDRIFYRDIGGRTLAVVAYTYGANYSIHRRTLTQEQEKHIDLLRPYTASVFLKSTGKRSLTERAFNKVLSGLKNENRAAIKKALGMTYNTPRKDDAVNPETAAPYLERFRRDIREAKERADIVLALPHVGGQFNPEPGAFTELVVHTAKEAGADAIIASHPHIVQKAAVTDGVPCFYSIGNFSMSPNSVYLLHENLPEYGLAAHVYVEDKAVVKTTFTILKIVEEKGTALSVWPVDKLPEPNEKEIAQIYRMVTNRELSDPAMRPEYEL